MIELSMRWGNQLKGKRNVTFHLVDVLHLLCSEKEIHRVPNKCTVSNNRTGRNICPKSTSRQDLISKHTAGIDKANESAQLS